jgi:hypothetical protein
MSRRARPSLSPERAILCSYELAVEEPVTRRVAVAFDELAFAI